MLHGEGEKNGVFGGGAGGESDERRDEQRFGREGKAERRGRRLRCDVERTAKVNLQDVDSEIELADSTHCPAHHRSAVVL